MLTSTRLSKLSEGGSPDLSRGLRLKIKYLPKKKIKLKSSMLFKILVNQACKRAPPELCGLICHQGNRTSSQEIKIDK